MSRSVRPPDPELSERLGHVFADRGLLELALLHPSAAHDRDGSRGNERLEFLGDAVLDLAVGRLLYEGRPAWNEGELTRARAALVNKRALAARARALGLASYLVLGRTEERSGGADKDRVLANLFEAVLGALYLDGGLPPVFSLVERVFADALADPERALRRDAKTRFQEWAHADRGATPRYDTLADTGVEEADDRFTVAAILEGERFGLGVGRTKRAAEQAAARDALGRVGEGGGG